MNSLYPPIETSDVYRLKVGIHHCLHVEACGRSQGVPVVFLHGGPGSGCRSDHRRYFDPDYYRILLPDQRGSGQSTPVGSTSENDTQALIADLEALRNHLRIDAWLVFGGSWGATLALAYAQAHPRAVLGMILRGIFLARRRDLTWFFGPQGAARLLPEAWECFRDHLPPPWRRDLIAGYHALVHGPDPAAAVAAARAWTAWADRVLLWDRTPALADEARGEVTDPLLAKVRIETHYARHRYFLREGQLLRQAGQLPAVPMVLVQGRRDLVCPPEAAWSLHRAVPHSRLVRVDAGHLITEPAMIDALVGETDRLRSSRA